MNAFAIILFAALNFTGLADLVNLASADPVELIESPVASPYLEFDIVPIATGYGDEELFTGEKRYACEAILCLSSPHRPAECDPALNYYYSIKRYKDGDFSASRTRSARKAFLNQCPSGDAYVQNVAGVISNTLNQCDAAYLNSRKIYHARAFDVLRGKWSNWKVLGKSNRDQSGTGRYVFRQTEFPACTTRQLNYAANLAAGKETPARYHPQLGWTYPVDLTCYESRAEIDPNPPADCEALFRSSYTYYQELKYENGTWVNK
ncbi:MAG: hypothetical protein LBV80_11520 [Deltaproteobacteria bacterium]|jgi:hypothetical protein|nr:hypothetical protein [Deltaproteobacteria bacterium]